MYIIKRINYSKQHFLEVAFSTQITSLYFQQQIIPVPDDDISRLPKEILLRILSYLDVVSLCRSAQVAYSLTYYRESFF